MATCSGENNVEAYPGFWRLQFKYANGHEYLDDSWCGTRWAEGDVCLFPTGLCHLLHLDVGILLVQYCCLLLGGTKDSGKTPV